MNIIYPQAFRLFFFPFPLDKGDKLRAYHQLNELKKSFDLKVVALDDANTPVKHVDKLKQEFDFEIWDDEKIALVDAAIHQLSNAINEAGLPPMPDYYKGEKFIEGADVSRRNIRVGSLYNKDRNM